MRGMPGQQRPRHRMRLTTSSSLLSAGVGGVHAGDGRADETDGAAEC